MPPFRLAPLEPTLTLNDLVSIYSVSKRTLWRWVKEGKLPSPLVVTRRIRRWKRSDIEAHLNNLKRRA